MNVDVLWIKNTDGKPDSVLTFAVLGFTAIMFKLFFAGMHLTIKPYIDWTFSGIDAGTIGAILVPTLGAYVSNRYVNLTQHPDYLRMRKDIDNDGKEEDILVAPKA